MQIAEISADLVILSLDFKFKGYFGKGHQTQTTKMNRIMTALFRMADKKAAIVLIWLVLAFVGLVMAQDFLQAHLRNSAFYFTESLLFSSFWWLFAPLLYMQYKAVKDKIKWSFGIQLTVMSLAIFLHLIAFPFLVWALSSLFYYHMYSFQQTLRYCISEHLYVLVSFYSIPVLVFQFISKKNNLDETSSETQSNRIANQFISTILVSDGNKKYPVNLSEILYLSANPPYINIHLEGKKYVYDETLKSISLKLNPEQFVRVHKSTIINIKMLTSFTTRHNGDYDLTMKDNIKLRLSRNFASDFKNLFNKTHQLTTK